MRHLPFAPPEREALLLLFCCVSAAALGRSLAVLRFSSKNGVAATGLPKVSTVPRRQPSVFFPGDFPVGGGSPSFTLPLPVTHIPFPSNTGTNAAQVRTLTVSLQTYSLLLLYLGTLLQIYYLDRVKRFFSDWLSLITLNQTFTVSVQPCCSGSSPRTSTLDTLSSS